MHLRNLQNTGYLKMVNGHGVKLFSLEPTQSEEKYEVTVTTITRKYPVKKYYKALKEFNEESI